MKQKLSSLSFRQSTKNQDQLSEFRVFCIQKGHRHLEHGSETNCKCVVNFMDTQFIPVNSGARDEWIQPSLDSESLLR
ncbi:hypothetical protein B0G75_11537 [Paraburkholderia sp. BL18I3N2]|nr:hypothetical protein B0G75_11537 [Paraburkholderia sp. BL18I3N2]